MASAKDRGSKSPTPSDDEFYDAYDGSDESDVISTTLHTATSRSPRHLSEWDSSEQEDEKTRKGEAKSDPVSMGDMEGGRLEGTADCLPPRPTDLHSNAHFTPVSKEWNSESTAPTSVSSSGQLSSCDKLDSCSTNNSPGGPGIHLTSLVSTVSDPANVTTSSDVPADDQPNSANTTRSSADSTTTDIYSASFPHPKSTASNLAGSASASPKKITKKRSRLKWTAAAREVVQADGEDGFRRSSSSSSLSSGSERRISTNTMLDDIAQVRR